MDAEPKSAMPDASPTVAARRIVFLGPPGSGKGTQAAILAQAVGIPAISTGEMLRAAVTEGSELGSRVEAIMNAGQLVDDETMADVVRDRLGKKDAADGFLLDGYPRTAPQAETLSEILNDREEVLDAVVLIDAPEDILVERALARKREDDKEEVIRQRLAVYREQTEPLIGYYKQLGLLQAVDGDTSIDGVTGRLFEALS